MAATPTFEDQIKAAVLASQPTGRAAGEVTAFVVLAEVTVAGVRRMVRVTSRDLPLYLERGLVGSRARDIGE